MNTNETILKNNQEEPELFAELKGKPKTLAGYGIEDGAQRNTSLPVITCGTGLGQDGREVATIEGDSTSGIISFTTSSHVVSNTELFTVNFSKPFEKTVYPVLFPASPLLEDTINYIYVTNVSNQGFTVMIGNKNNLQNYTNYKLTYNIL